MKSTFKSDLEKEQKLSVLLDENYTKYLRCYDFERIHDKKRQFEGVDVKLINSKTGNIYLVDEKAQLDYINESLPTFAFELSYLKNGVEKEGWLFDQGKRTDFYSLVTNIYCDEPGIYTSCKITFVNRSKLISFLATKDYTKEAFTKVQKIHRETHGMVVLERLDTRTEGYLYFSSKNKSEKPINLVLKLDFLIKIGVAKRLI